MKGLHLAMPECCLLCGINGKEVRLNGAQEGSWYDKDQPIIEAQQVIKILLYT